MSDIIDIIDGLHAEATKGPLRRSEASGVIESSDGVFVASGTWPHDGNMLVALVNNWPSISARLREAERERDEWKLASSKNGDAMIGYQSRAIVAEQRLVEAERKAAAWDVIADGHIHREDDGFTFSGFIGKDSSWGRTIKAAIAAKETKQ